MAEVPNRIISLVPSLTELIIDLGLQKKLVGRTRFCVHPQDKVADIPIIGGTKNPNLDKIQELNPDYIVANKEENRKEDIQALRHNFTINLTEIAAIEDALITINELGQKLGVAQKSDQLISDIQSKLDHRPKETKLRTAYLIWKDPWMTIGNDTYINDVMAHWHLENVFSDKNRYPTFELQELQHYNPDLILLSSEPFPFKEKHLQQVENACPNSRVLLVEGEWFSWYGSHMNHAFGRLNMWRKVIA